MSYFRVDTSALHLDADDISVELDMIINDFEKIYGDIRELGNMWKGVANKRFTQSFYNDYQCINSFLYELKKYATRLEKESDLYNNCENVVLEMVEEI